MERLAWAITKEVYPKVDYYIDLHSGDDFEALTPYVYYAGKAAQEVTEVSRKMAEQVDVPYMVRSMVSSGGAYNYAASKGIASILLERGGMGAWTSEEVNSDKRDVRNILSSLGMYQIRRDVRNYVPMEVTDVRYQAASEDGLWYPAAKPGDMVAEGALLGTIRDYNGKLRETCRAEYTGVVLYQTGSLQVTKGALSLPTEELCASRSTTTAKSRLSITGRNGARAFRAETLRTCKPDCEALDERD